MLIYNTSFNGSGFRGGSRRIVINDQKELCKVHKKHEPDKLDRLTYYERVQFFCNPLLEVAEMDFRQSLYLHPNTFAYCDPPYPVSACLYGDSPEYHSEFPHEELAAILCARDQWTLSYNDVPQIRDLYPADQFDWYPVQWNQDSRNRGDNVKGNDVVITPRGQHHATGIDQTA